MSQGNQSFKDFMTNPIWAFLASIATILGLLFAIFVWIAPAVSHSNSDTLTPTRPTTHVTTIPHTPAGNTTVPSTVTPPTNSPGTANLFICRSGAVCSSYPMMIWIKNVTINADQTAAWNFQLENGENAVHVYLNIYIDTGGIQYGNLNLQPGESRSITVLMNAAPTNDSVHKILFDLEGSFPLNINPEYSQSCTYLASQQTCQP